MARQVFTPGWSLPLSSLPVGWRWVMALLPTVVVLASRPWMPAVLKQTPAVLHYPPVLLAAWLGGLGPGVTSTLACTVYSVLVLRPHLLSAPLDDVPGLLRTGMFLVTSVGFSALVAGLQQAVRQAARAVALRDEFITLASHELRTPLTTMRLNLYNTRRLLGMPVDDEAIKARTTKLVDGLDRQLTRLERLILDMFDVSMLESGMKLSPEPLDLAALGESLAPKAAAVGSVLSVRVTGPVEGSWDRRWVQQLVANLLDNAIKYGQGRPVDVEVLQQDGQVHVVVQDHGVGIAPEDRQRIFEKFARVSPPGLEPGLGLGLYVADQTARLHGGRIDVESTLGAGTRFTVVLPRTVPVPR
ncbi:MAG: ATP-binding protein [Myxococcota bacterium]